VDYSRSNGLVEDIRQSILLQEERARLEEEGRPKKPLTHEMSAPIALPTIAGSRAAGGSAAAAGGGDDAPAPAAPAATPARQRPRINAPTGGGTRNVERVE
jgi:hypothetical protein